MIQKSHHGVVLSAWFNEDVVPVFRYSKVDKVIFRECVDFKEVEGFFEGVTGHKGFMEMVALFCSTHAHVEVVLSVDASILGAGVLGLDVGVPSEKKARHIGA